MADSAGTTDPDGDAAVAAGMPICVTTSAKVPAREEEMTAAVAPVLGIPTTTTTGTAATTDISRILKRMRTGTGGRGRGQGRGRGASSEAEAADAEEEETKEKGTTQQPPGGSFGTMYR